jgi:hypothetical protein
VRSSRLRVAFLLFALAVAAAWAYARLSARAERKGWERTVEVVVYVLGTAEPRSMDELRQSLSRLSSRLAEDRAAYGPGPPPFRFDAVGPITPDRYPPGDSPGASFLDRFAYEVSLWQAERAVRAVAPEPDPHAYDVRVYLVLVPATDRSFAEGVAEAGGEVAVVHAALGEDALLAATAVAHEALHTVGATDKYDPAGHAIAPAGLYEPNRDPPFPQARAEIMVGELPLAPGKGRLPESAAELGVGPETAREIGWIPKASP